MPEIKERPILFSAPMVRAILKGRKTVTRRAVKGLQIPTEDTDAEHAFRWTAVAQNHPRYGFTVSGETPEACAAELALYCPHGRRGDRLWVRETFALLGNEDGVCVDWSDNLQKGDEKSAAKIYRASCIQGDYGLWEVPDIAAWKPKTNGLLYEGAWRPSIHMPRWASRILLEITEVRVERLQDISEEQAEAEGVGAQAIESFRAAGVDRPAGFAFRDLWTSINGDGAWSTNPWVWVIEFKQVTP